MNYPYIQRLLITITKLIGYSMEYRVSGTGIDPEVGLPDLDSSVGVRVQGKSCTNLEGNSISSDTHVPGPEKCTLCACGEYADGDPLRCKAMLCFPPLEEDCWERPAGHFCCDFICLNDTLNKNGRLHVRTGGPLRPFNGPIDIDAEDFPTLSLIAICSIVLSSSLMLCFIYRLRKRQVQGRLNSSMVSDKPCDTDGCDESP